MITFCINQRLVIVSSHFCTLLWNTFVHGSKGTLTYSREFHRANKTLKTRIIAKGHIVIVYEEKRPRQMWRLGKIVGLINTFVQL